MSERLQAVINGREKLTGYKNILNTIYLIKFSSKFGGWVWGKIYGAAIFATRVTRSSTSKLKDL